MPYIHVDDGYPESVEFENNYVWIDNADPASIAAVEPLLKQRRDIATPSREVSREIHLPPHRRKFWDNSVCQ